MTELMLQNLYKLMNITFISYILFIVIKYKVQSSVSESYYRLPYNLQWVFTIVTWTYALCAIIIGLDKTGSGLVFFAGGGIVFVGAAPLFHTKDGKHTLEGMIHVIGAIVGILFFFLFITIVLHQWYILVGFIIVSGISYLIKPIRKNYTWWVEIYTYISLDISYYLILY